MAVPEQSDYCHLQLSGTQWDLERQVTDVLKPLQIATTALNMEQNPNMSFVYPVMHGFINDHLQTKNEAEDSNRRRLEEALPMTGTQQDAQKNLA